MSVPATNEDYLREIRLSKEAGMLTDGMLDIMEEFVNVEADRRDDLGFPHFPKHKEELVNNTIAMFEAGLLEKQVLGFNYEPSEAKQWFASKAACVFSAVTNKRIWGR